LFSLILSELDSVAALLNEAIEVMIEDGAADTSRFEVPQNSQNKMILGIISHN
jgi:hypothetical protein